jgi:hypothetical protein
VDISARLNLSARQEEDLYRSIDKDYVTEEVMVAKRKDWEVAILNISNLK